MLVMVVWGKVIAEVVVVGGDDEAMTDASK